MKKKFGTKLVFEEKCLKTKLTYYKNKNSYRKLGKYQDKELPPENVDCLYSHNSASSGL